MAVIKESSGDISVRQEFIDKQTIEEGDMLVLTFKDRTKLVIVEKVKVSDSDGIEIIYDLKQNHYFNLTMYREDKSTVHCIYRVISK